MTLADAYLALFALLQSISRDEARELAAGVTARINDALAAGRPSIDSCGLKESVREVVAGLPVQPAALPIVWQALAAAQTGRIDPWLYQNQIYAILATAPMGFQKGAFAPWNKTQPDAASLRSALTNILFSAQYSLYVVNPYWSAEGVRRLKSYQPANARVPSSVVIMTSCSDNSYNTAGLDEFSHWMEERGSVVERLVPRPLQDGSFPLVHAKVMIADGKMAYIGSANLSENGLHRSIEAGVTLQGPAALNLAQWFVHIRQFFELMDQ